MSTVEVKKLRAVKKNQPVLNNHAISVVKTMKHTNGTDVKETVMNGNHDAQQPKKKKQSKKDKLEQQTTQNMTQHTDTKEGSEQKAPKKVRKPNTKKISLVEQPTQTAQATQTAQPTQPTQQTSMPVVQLDQKTETVVKPKKQANNKPTQMDKVGIGIGHARVKAVLIEKSLNPQEHLVCQYLARLNNKMQDPTKYKDVPPAIEERWDSMKYVADRVCKNAERAHDASLRKSYEHDRINSMDEKTKSSYLLAKKTSIADAEKANRSFDLTDFNKTYDPKFYSNYESYKDKNDAYAVRSVDKDGNALYADKTVVLNKKDEPIAPKYNKYTRSIALISKTCTRLSGNTKFIIACFLDRLVEQYTRNGVHKAFLTGSRTVSLEHALSEDDAFHDQVSLNKFVKTLDAYSTTLKWMDAKKQSNVSDNKQNNTQNNTQANAQLNSNANNDQNTSNVLGDYHTVSAHDFDGYVKNICKSVKMSMAKKPKREMTPDVELADEAKRTTYLNTNVSAEFKKFCSAIVYETILRIGSCLRESIRQSGVKTVSDEMVYHVLKQIHNVCGMDYLTVDNEMVSKMQQFTNIRAQQKDLRKAKREEVTSKLLSETSDNVTPTPQPEAQMNGVHHDGNDDADDYSEEDDGNDGNDVDENNNVEVDIEYE